MTYPGNQPTLPSHTHNPGKRLLARLSRWWDAGPWQKVALFAAIPLLLVCACSGASLMFASTPYGQQIARETASTATLAQAASAAQATATATAHGYALPHPAPTTAPTGTDTLMPHSSPTTSPTGMPSSHSTPTPTVAPTNTSPPYPTSTPVPTATDTPPPSSHVIFSDNFSGSALSTAWTIVNRHGEYAQDETECNVPGAVGVANHVLTISTTAQRATCGDFNLDGSVRHSPSTWPYTTGDVQWTSFAFTYGTITYSARFPPQATGTWPAIWLLGSNCQATNIVTADTGYASCPAIYSPGYVEIDLTECYTTSWCQLALAQASSFPTCGYALDSTWHTFSVSWTPSAISVWVDGQSTGCTFSAADGYTIPSTPMFLLIQTQTGGVAGTPNDSNLPATLQVSSVTITQP